MTLTLVDMPSWQQEAARGALREREAARYINLSLTVFRGLVREGMIVARRHPGRTRRIFLKADLDHYLGSLPMEHKS